MSNRRIYATKFAHLYLLNLGLGHTLTILTHRMSTLYLLHDEIGTDLDLEHLSPGGHIDARHSVDRGGLWKAQKGGIRRLAQSWVIP
jgi:hypothetical protein